jgi:hypothetical protein
MTRYSDFRVTGVAERVARAILPIIQEHIIDSLTKQGVEMQNVRPSYDSLSQEDQEAMLRVACAALKAAEGDNS